METVEEKLLRYMNEAVMDNWDLYGDTPEEAQEFFNAMKERERLNIERFFGENNESS